MRIAQVSPLYESCPPQLYGVLKGWFHILPKSLFVRDTKSLYLRAVIPKLMES